MQLTGYVSSCRLSAAKPNNLKVRTKPKLFMSSYLRLLGFADAQPYIRAGDFS